MLAQEAACQQHGELNYRQPVKTKIRRRTMIKVNTVCHSSCNILDINR